MKEHRTCYSGGASGADLAWGDAARANGYRVEHLSFAGHKTEALPSERRELTNAELRHANAFLARAAPGLSRSWPPRLDYTRKLLQRNFWQVAQTRAIYAVGWIENDQTVRGGTGWAVQLYKDRTLPDDLRCYAFDQSFNRWFGLARDGWFPIDEPPSPPTTFTGVGTRDLAHNGAEAIRGVFR